MEYLKNKTVKQYFFVIPLCLLFLIDGCVIFKNNNIPTIGNEEIRYNSNKKTKIFVKWDFDFLPMAHSKITYEDRENLFKRVLEESSCCELVKKSNANVVLNVKSYDQRNPSRIIGWAISAATIYIIPSWHTAKIFVVADVAKENESHHYEASDSMVTAIWLPLIVATPFAYDLDKTQEEIMRNSFRALILRIKNDNLL